MQRECSGATAVATCLTQRGRETLSDTCREKGKAVH
jgi:hypothetical protein